MPFTPKNWENAPSTATPLSAAALEDLETRVTDYTDTVAETLSVSDANASTKGIVKLAGDLGGTADAPTVTGLGVFTPGYLVNGSFGLWRRGTGPFTANGFCADNWKIELGTSGVISVTYDDVNSMDIWSARCAKATYTHGTGATRIYQPYRDWKQTRTRKITFRGWAQSSVPNAVRLAIYDGVNRAYSSYHPGNGTYQELRVTLDVNDANTCLHHELWMEASGTFRFDTFDAWPYKFEVPNRIPYWSADPAVERTRCKPFYQRIPVNIRVAATANNERFTVPIQFGVDLIGTPAVTLAVAGTRTNVHDTPSYTAVDGAGGYVTFTSAGPGEVSILGDILELTVEP